MEKDTRECGGAGALPREGREIDWEASVRFYGPGFLPFHRDYEPIYKLEKPVRDSKD